ncbi:hypothetical protein L6R49_26520 [Myxococcota bacterium]|nr:hypothetical protein [Myxococcota bacterium]
MSRALLLPLLFAAACDKGDGVTSEDTGADPPFTASLPNGGCGLPEYTWRSDEDLGEIVAWEELRDLRFTAEALNAALSSFDLGAVATATYDVEVYRVRYVTQDKGQRVEATALLSFPVNDEDESVLIAPTMLWMHGTTGFTDECAPSALGVEGALFNIVFSGHGFVVAAPDYLGMNGFGDPAEALHPYIVAEPTAVVSLDAVRALHRFARDEANRLSSQPSDDMVLWGVSEGGFAALWADRYGDAYLPGHRINGVVAAVPATDPTHLAKLGVTTYGDTSLAMAASLATQNLWYGEPAPLSDAINDDAPGYPATSLLAELAASCSPDVPEQVVSVETLFQPALVDALVNDTPYEPWSCYLDQGAVVGSAIPRGSDAPVKAPSWAAPSPGGQTPRCSSSPRSLTTSPRPPRCTTTSRSFAPRATTSSTFSAQGRATSAAPSTRCPTSWSG